MKSRNYAALALLLTFTLAERFAYYAFRATVFPRLLQTGEFSEALASAFMASSWTYLLFGFLLGGGISVATRSRWWLAGAALLLLIAHGYCATTRLFYFAGLPALMVFTGVVRAPLYVALAEELDQSARFWKAIAIVGLDYFVSEVGGGLSGFIAPFVSRASPAAVARVTLPASVLAFVACAVLAYAPAIVQRDQSPNRWIPLLGLFALVASTAATATHNLTIVDFAIKGFGPGLSKASPQQDFPLQWILVSFGALFMHLLVAAVAAVCASRRAQFAPTWILGAGLALQGLALLLSIGASAPSAVPFALGAHILDSIGQGLVVTAALGYAVGAVASRWAGAVAATFGIATALTRKGPAAAFDLSALTASAVTWLFATGGALLLLAALTVLVLGPKLQRSSAYRV
jgi:hypothetical protein